MTATQAEIVARIEERMKADMFGFEWHEYLKYLDFEHAKPYLKADTTAEEWHPVPFTRDAVIREMEDYMEFAFDKANCQRGISANRSVLHYVAWTWLAGDNALSEWIDQEYGHNYCLYGKLILRHICDHYGWRWEQWDDGVLTNG